MKQIIITIIGLIFASLGLLWFLQGADLIRIEPILCVANCEPVTGVTPSWIITGIVTFLIGATLCFIGLKSKNQQKQ